MAQLSLIRAYRVSFSEAKSMKIGQTSDLSILPGSIHVHNCGDYLRDGRPGRYHSSSSCSSKSSSNGWCSSNRDCSNGSGQNGQSS